VVIVSAIWPGATAADMQDQVADPIEKKLQELPFVDKVTTYTKPSFTAMQVAFKDNTPARDVPELFYQLRKKISDIKEQLPAGLIGPAVNDEYGDVDSILYMLTADGAGYAQMKKVAEALRQRLLKVKDVTKVNLYGIQDEKIYLEFSHAKLATLGITPDQMFQSLARQNAVVPAGVVETNAQRVPLRVTGALDGVKAVAETPVEANGRTFRLGDIATVKHGYVDPQSFAVRQKGKPAIGIGVVMAKAPISWSSVRTSRTPRRSSWPPCRTASISSRLRTSPWSSSMRSANLSPPSWKPWQSSFSSASWPLAGAPVSWLRCRCLSSLPWFSSS
jgi:multidrug efflux pump